MKLDSKEAIERAFEYQPPTEEQKVDYIALRSAAKALAMQILDHCPSSEERTLALRRLHEALMLANASVALN